MYIIKCKPYVLEHDGIKSTVEEKAVYRHKIYKDKYYVQTYMNNSDDVRLFATKLLSKAKEVLVIVQKNWGDNFHIYDQATDKLVK